jgi:membrane associated rhomboid family serine protease
MGRKLKLVLGILALLVGVQVFNTLTGNSLLEHGIYPRTLSGLQGVVFAPWLHGSIRHLLSNMLPLAVLSWLVMTEGIERYLRVSALICLVGGVLVWALGRASLHVGASGLVFGLWAYVLARAWYERGMLNVLIAILVMLAYSGLVFGFIPVPGVSFESHVFGACAGVLVGWLMHSKKLVA